MISIAERTIRTESLLKSVPPQHSLDTDASDYTLIKALPAFGGGDQH